MDQLPGLGAVLRADLAHRRRLLLLPRRPPAPHHALPLNNVPLDGTGRCFYIRDGEDVWSPGWLPMKSELASYECRHGLGYTVISSERNGIHASLLAFVPLGMDCEVHRLTLKNVSKQRKEVTVFSCVEFCLWNALDDMTNFQRNFSIGEVEVDLEESTIYHKTEYRERRDHYAFYSANAPLAGFDTDRESFLGTYNGYHDPQVPLEGRSRQSVASGWAPIASHSVKVSLAPLKEKVLIFVLGYIENDRRRSGTAPGDQQGEGPRHEGRLRDTGRRGGSAGQAAKFLGRAAGQVRPHRQGRPARQHGQHLERLPGDGHLQHVAQRLVLRVGHRPGMGFRDSNQDLLGFVHMIPARARERILDIASTQFEDGGRTTSTSR